MLAETVNTATTAPEPPRAVIPLVMECRCGAILRLASAWSKVACGKCGAVLRLE